MMSNQTVLITGSSSGLGNVVTRSLLEKGYTVFATMRAVNGKNAQSAAQLRSLAPTPNAKFRVLDLDVTSDTSVQAAVQEILTRAGTIDILINNAGIFGGGYAEAFSTEQLQQIFEVNLFGIQRMMRAVLPSMRQRRSGLVINISSIQGRLVIPFASAYTASKYALEALSESYRYELAPTGVEVVIVEPGGFSSAAVAKMITPEDQERTRSYGSLAVTPDKLWSGIRSQMQSEQFPRPQVVADAVVQLIETPVGHRPLRVVVDPLTGGAGPTAINETTSQIQGQLLESLGLNDLLVVDQR